MAAHKSKRINHSKKTKKKKQNEQNNTYKLLCFMYGRWILYWKKIGKYKNHEHEPPTLSEMILK